MLKNFSIPISSILFVLSGACALGAFLTIVSSGATQAFAGFVLATLFFFVIAKMTR